MLYFFIRMRTPRGNVDSLNYGQTQNHVLLWLYPGTPASQSNTQFNLKGSEGCDGNHPKKVAYHWGQPFTLLSVVLLVPLSKVAEAFAEGDLGGETEVALQGGGIGIGGGDIAGLHRHQLFVGLEVVVLRQDTGSQEFLLQDVHEVQEVLGLTATDVVHLVGRDGQTVFAGLLGRSHGHHSCYSLNNVVHVREIPAAVAVVVDLDDLALQQLVGEAKIRHIRPAGRTVHGEEAQAGAGDIVQLAVAMRHELVTLLGGGIEGDGIVHPVVGAERHLLVAAIDAGGAGVDQVLDTLVARFFALLRMTVLGVPARLQDVVKANDVALDIDIRILDAVAHTRLSSKVYYNVKLIFFKQLVYQFTVSNAALH